MWIRFTLKILCIRLRHVTHYKLFTPTFQKPAIVSLFNNTKTIIQNKQTLYHGKTHYIMSIYTKSCNTIVSKKTHQNNISFQNTLYHVKTHYIMFIYTTSCNTIMSKHTTSFQNTLYHGNTHYITQNTRQKNSAKHNHVKIHYIISKLNRNDRKN